MNTDFPKGTNTEFANFSEAKTLILKDIREKWRRFSEDALGNLLSNDNLACQIADKYNIDEAQAQMDVRALMQGRQI